jgi:hypothetical protein
MVLFIVKKKGGKLSKKRGIFVKNHFKNNYHNQATTLHS